MRSSAPEGLKLPPVLEALVPARRSEMQSEGIPWQSDRNAVVHRYIDGKRSRRSDPLHRHVLRGQRNLMLLRLLDHGRDQLVIGGVRIGAAYNRDAFQIVLKRIIRQLRRRNLK